MNGLDADKHLGVSAAASLYSPNAMPASAAVLNINTPSPMNWERGA